MAQYALPPGAARRRAIFGLLDADGWGYAGLKAAWWFLLLIFMLGYIPNLAYYFTVGNTVDVGYDFLSVVNWCPASNGNLPCPAPAGAVVPWEPSPTELALPAPRSGAVLVQSGTHLYLVGGTTPAGAVADTAQTTITLDGNLAPWSAGPALPEVRTDAALATLSGVPYVIGGLDASGKPTATVYEGVLDAGQLTGWVLADGSNGTVDLTLPTAVSGGGAVPTASGLYLFGGRSADGLTDVVLHSTLDTTASVPALGAWAAIGALPLPEPRADAAAVAVGDAIYVLGGEGPDAAATASIFRLRLKSGEPLTDEAGAFQGWAVAPASQQLPDARARATGFTANGSLYLVGGADATGAPQSSNWWAVPDAKTGDLPAWHHLDQTQLSDARAGASVAAVGSFAFLIGGDTASGPTDSSLRANLSPQPPYFRLGLFGLTLPALSIKGEIGQQLGYINAMTVGMVNFAVLIVIGLAFSHRAQTLRLLERVTRGRFRAPREDEFNPTA